MKVSAIKNATALFLVCVLCLFAFPSALFAAQAGFVTGRVMFHAKPVPGATVYAYTDPAELFRKESAPPVTSGPDGRFKMKLPRGEFYLAAMKKLAGPDKGSDASRLADAGRPAPGDLYAFYGGNPVVIDPFRKAKITINLMVKPKNRETTVCKEKEKGGIEGTVTLDGKPLDGVTLYIYLDSDSSFRGLGYYMSPPTGVDGRFKMRMNEGTYYLVARKRMNREVTGPLKVGDYYGYLDINPLVVHKGKVLHVEFPVMMKVEKAAPGGQGFTIVSGTIKDKNGKPLKGMYACLYKNDTMTNRPAIVSGKTGDDGVFNLEVPFSGKYYLGARSVLGKPVDNGQYWGRYDGDPDHSVVIEAGKTVGGLDITADVVGGK